MVPLTSIVGKKIHTMEVNETRNRLVTDILLNIRKSCWMDLKTVKLNCVTLRE